MQRQAPHRALGLMEEAMEGRQPRAIIEAGRRMDDPGRSAPAPFVTMAHPLLGWNCSLLAPIQPMKVPPDPPPISRTPSSPPEAAAPAPTGRRRPRTLPSTPRSILDAMKQGGSNRDPS